MKPRVCAPKLIPSDDGKLWSGLTHYNPNLSITTGECSVRYSEGSRAYGNLAKVLSKMASYTSGQTAHHTSSTLKVLGAKSGSNGSVRYVLEKSHLVSDTPTHFFSGSFLRCCITLSDRS